MPYVTTGDGTRLYYEDWGAGRPVVLLAPGVMGSRAWEFQASWLARRGLRSITYDRRGCGRSDRPWSGYDYDTLADDLEAVLRDLDLRGVTLVGCAAGAGEAVRHLARHGADRVAGLVLVSPTTPFMMRAPDNPDGIDPALLEEMAAAVDADRPRWAAGLAAPFFGGSGAGRGSLPVSPELARWMAELALDSSPRATQEIYRTLFTTDQRAETAAVGVPTLVIHGEADLAAPVELCGVRTAALVRGSSLLRYEGAAHGLFASHADRLNKDILAFLSG
ncbi:MULTISPECIES: alpha/beta fold hydrolase [Streptomyces]|uniref:alpha/beta fold hydrolase n=1 Tax=Streptomyces TaxID=1883 RepID=UPI000F7A8FB6|nr:MULTISPECIES: alpha/beta hydrolase [Streptomyces]RST06949.1 alpha/beta hydrolase [Streptomyces sp. WAC07149]GLX17137.1 arylesterase [Streptomyces lavendulae subsp. lavendulae]GLX29645.1 arylesterase [Streptomyces lavendulae subsp. lavendulae]